MSENDLWIAAYGKVAGALLPSTTNDFSRLVPKHLDGEIIVPAITSRQHSE
jgi:hypothetical protein